MLACQAMQNCLVMLEVVKEGAGGQAGEVQPCLSDRQRGRLSAALSCGLSTPLSIPHSPLHNPRSTISLSLRPDREEAN